MSYTADSQQGANRHQPAFHHHELRRGGNLTNRGVSAGTVRLHPRRPGGSHLVRRDGGDGGSPAQVRGRATDPGACWEDAAGPTVQGEQEFFSLS